MKCILKRFKKLKVTEIILWKNQKEIKHLEEMLF